MAILKQINASDKKTTRSFLNQLIDVLQEDISSSVSRRKYQVFVTGGIGPGVTSSLFQPVYDQDFTLQTANPVFDITIGLASPDSIRGGTTTNINGVAYKASTGQDTGGKYLYPSSSLMMREKTDIYGQFAQTLLGNRTNMFQLPVDATLSSNQTTTPVDTALFIAFKRLFSRDQIKRETFAMRFYQTASLVTTETPAKPNIFITSNSGSAIFTDIGAADSRYFDIGGQYGYLVDASSTTKTVGLMYYDSGIAVLDIEKITSSSQFISGTISAMTPLGQTVLGGLGTETYNKAKIVPDLMVSASVDDIVDHFSYSRFGDGAMTRAEALRRGLEAVRAGIGDDAYLLGCGSPLLSAVGIVDAMRVSEDVAPFWESTQFAPGWQECSVAARTAIEQSVLRAPMHRRWFLNDPDCLLLRPTSTDLTSDERLALATSILGTGAYLIVSDDLSTYTTREWELLDRLIELQPQADTTLDLGDPFASEVTVTGEHLRLKVSWDRRTASLETTSGRPVVL